MLNGYHGNSAFWKDFINLSNNPYKLKTDLSGFRCLFVYVSTQDDLSTQNYPISFGYMTSLLRMNGADATILVPRPDTYDKRMYSDFDLICFYPMVALLHKTLEIASEIKNDFQNSRICLFNSDQHQHEMILCTPKAADYAQTLMMQCSSVDFVLVGEAESSFVKLCEKLATGDNGFADIPSCFYRKDNIVEFSGKPIESVNFDMLPFPSRDFLERGISDGVNIFSPRIQSSRGCVSPCLFCAESSRNITENGRKRSWLGRNIDKFVDEIELLSKQYKVAFFNVIDSSFEDPGRKGIERINHFCDEIISRDILSSFKIHLRVETIGKLDDELLLKLKEAGVDVLVIGIESGISRELRSYRKITTLKENSDNIHRLDQLGKFFNFVGFMMFSPFLDLKDLFEKVQFMKRINRGWDYLAMSRNLLVYKGTAYHDLIDTHGLALEYDMMPGVASYKYQDGRVKYVADEMGKLKVRCPEIVSLNNLLYDVQNIMSRYGNKINKHLWKKETSFLEFRERIDQILFSNQKVLSQYFIDLIDLADMKWSDEKAELIYLDQVHNFISDSYRETKKLIKNILKDFEDSGLATNRLYLKTWISLTDTQINTAGGSVV